MPVYRIGADSPIFPTPRADPESKPGRSKTAPLETDVRHQPVEVYVPVTTMPSGLSLCRGDNCAYSIYNLKIKVTD